MKKLIKRKLFFINGCSKNLFLWELPDAKGKGTVFEVIEEFKGHSIARTMLRGIYKGKLEALMAFRKFSLGQASTSAKVPFKHQALIA